VTTVARGSARSGKTGGAAWVWLAGGVSLGIFAAGWEAARRTGFMESGVWSWRLAAPALAVGVVAACVLGVGLAWAGQRWLGLAPAEAERWSARCTWPWLAAGPGLFLVPWFARFGGGLQLDVLGQVRAPWQSGFTALPPAGYLSLLWVGPWLTLPCFLALISGVLRRQAGGEGAELRPLRPARLWVVAACFYLALSVWTTTVYPPTGDEVHYLLQAESLVQDHDLDLSNNLAKRDFRKFYPAPELDEHALPGRPGWSKHFPALAYVLAPAYALAGRWGAAALLALLAAAAAAAVFSLARALGASERAALWAWALAVLSPPLATYFDLVLTEVPAAWFLLMGVLAWRHGGSRGALGSVLCACALGWLYPKYLPVSLVLGLALPWAPGVRLRDLWLPGVLAAAAGAAYLWVFGGLYGFRVGGNPFGEFHALWSAHSLKNFLGLWVDRDYGLLATAPAFLLALGGAAVRARAEARAAILTGAVLALHLVQYTLFVDFTGTGSVLSRYLLPAAVLLWPFAAFGAERIETGGGRAERGLAWALAAFGVLWAWLAAAWPMLRYLSPKQALWAKLGGAPYLFPSLELAPGAGSTLWAAAWLALFAWLAWRLMRTTAIRP
jgi:hypothetical protein